MVDTNRKRGRPKLFMSKQDRVEVRLTKEQLYRLNVVAKKTGKTKTDIINDGIKIQYDLHK